MPRRSLPSSRKRLVFIFGCVLSIALLQGALWKTAQSRREYIEQQQRAAAWRVPEVVIGTSTYKLTLSPDERLLTCQMPSWAGRVFDARTGYLLGQSAAPPSSTDDTSTRTYNGTRIWLPRFTDLISRYQLRVEHNGRSSVLTKVPLVFSLTTTLDALQLSPDGLRCDVLQPDSLTQFDMRSQQILRVVHPQTKSGHWGAKGRYGDGTYAKAVISPDSKYIITLTPRPTLYNAHTGQKIRSFGQELQTEFDKFGTIVPQTGFSPDSKIIWVYDEKNLTTTFWRIAGGPQILQFAGRIAPDGGERMFDSTSQYIIDHKTDTLYNVADGKMVRKLTPGEATTLVVAPHNHILYTLRPDGRIYHYPLP